MGMPSNKIYKYYNFNKSEEGLVYSLDALSNNYVYASAPSTFNDPFDCAVQAALDLTPEVLTIFYQSKLMKDEEIQARISNFFDRGGRLTEDGHNVQESFRQQISSMNQNLGVACFSKQPYNPLMWAHYSNNHNGFCLEFDLDPPFKSNEVNGGKNLHIWGEIEYANSGHLPRVALSDFLSGSLNTLNLILKKGGRWKYEEERRLIISVDNEEDRKVEFAPELLTGIYYGINVDIKLKEETKVIMASRYPHAVEHELKVSDQYYWLDKV